MSVKGTPNRPAVCTAGVCEQLSNACMKRGILDQCYLLIYFSVFVLQRFCLSLNVIEGAALWKTFPPIV